MTPCARMWLTALQVCAADSGETQVGSGGAAGTGLLACRVPPDRSQATCLQVRPSPDKMYLCRLALHRLSLSPSPRLRSTLIISLRADCRPAPRHRYGPSIQLSTIHIALLFIRKIMIPP